MAFRREPLALMGNGRALNIPRTGDVVLINTGDGVFTGREPQTPRQTKQITSLLIATY